MPLLDLLGVQLLEDGSTVRADGLERTAWANQYGALHGGVLACVAEMAAARLLGERALSTSHVHVAYLRAARTAGVSIVARAVHRGRTFGLAEALGVDDDGRLCCRATITARA